MIIIGEKINGTIPSVKEAITNHDGEFIRNRAIAQEKAGATYLDCAASTSTDIEYETMCWLINEIQSVSDLPISIDSPNAKLLAKIIESGILKRPGLVNSVNEEGDKCETIFPIIAGTEWNVLGLTCDKTGIPSESSQKIEIAKSIISKADKYGVARQNVHIDPCVMALATKSDAMEDFVTCIHGIHEFAPEVKVSGAISNISFSMPLRKYVNQVCFSYAIEAGLDSAIMDPCSMEMMGTLYASDALCQIDKGGRKYNRAYRQGKIGKKK